jgi:dipeptidyl aminopeptidase/acylaminoacyl peptidase
MNMLRGNWGVCDVEDSVSGAKYLADNKKVDAKRLAIMGGSAGGYTVLQTMATVPTAFTAGISMYGIADQFALVQATHKFEAKYNDSLLGPLPEAAELYKERSPLTHAKNIKRPLAVFQGSVDPVVPKEQADMIVGALKRNGTDHIYHVYEGEGHGWGKPETIEHFYNEVDKFLKKYVIYT